MAPPGIPADISVAAVRGRATEEAATAAKIRFLGEAAAYPDRPSHVEVVETHMSWVFLTDRLVYKLKKPVASTYFDFTSLAGRERNCRYELRLNRRLAADIYRGLARLTRAPDGRLALDGEGETVDWLVVMRRLPRERMLDSLIVAHALDQAALERLGERLARFYSGQPTSRITPTDYVNRFRREQAANREVLAARAGLTSPRNLLDRFDAAFSRRIPLLEERARSGRIVDGHGDLRPEHVCMTHPIVIFDCLEFSDELRQMDPVDEIAFLGMECGMLGDGWIGPELTAYVLARLRWPASEASLAPFYAAFRALLRARQCLSHLLDPLPREAEKWRPLAERYAAAADAALLRLGD